MRVISVIGPAQSGKTSLTAALSRLDSPGEHLSIAGGALGVQSFRYLGDEWAALDIAGGPDTLAHAGPALAASDAVVLCLPAEAEAAVLAAPYFRLIEAADIPAIIFINKVDAAEGRMRDIVAALQTYSAHPIVLRQVPLREDGHVVGAIDLISERAWRYREGQHSDLIEMPRDETEREQQARTELLESLADFDDHLLEELIEDKRPPTGEVYDLSARALRDNALHPALMGSAEHGNGLTRLMKSLRHEAPEVGVLRARLAEGERALAIAVAGDIRKHLGKIVLVRALAAGVGTGARLGGGNIGTLAGLDTRTQLAELAPGQIGVAVKSDHLKPSHLLAETAHLPAPGWAAARAPGHRHLIAPASERDDSRLSAALGRLAEIDPGLGLEQDAQTGKPVLACQGPLHARRVIEALQENFGVAVTEEEVPAAYRETITRRLEHHHRHRKQTGGAGQFADVVIEVAPAPRGAGFGFTETVKGGAVPRNYIPAVEAGAQDALAAGPRGFPVVDLTVTLKDGKHHAVDSSDFAFRTAGRNAVKEALEKLGSIVLQPILSVTIHVPSAFSGALVPLVSGLKGQVLGFEANPEAPGWDIFRAYLAASARDELTRALGGASRGTAWAEMSFDHYEEMHGAEAPAAGA